VGKNVSDRFPIRNGLKQGDALSPMLFNFALEYAIRRVQVNQRVRTVHRRRHRMFHKASTWPLLSINILTHHSLANLAFVTQLVAM